MWPLLAGTLILGAFLGALFATMACAAGKADAAADNARDVRQTVGKLDEWEAMVRAGYWLTSGNQLALIEAVRWYAASEQRATARVLAERESRAVRGRVLPIEVSR